MGQRMRRDAIPLLALFARYWIVSTALVVFVVAASVAQVVLAPRHYVVTQQLQVVVFASTGAPEDAGPVARALVDPVLLTSPRLATDILARISTDQALRDEMSAPALQDALAATHSGAGVTLSATWTSQAGAEAILVAAVDALQTDGSLLPSSLTDGSVRVQTVGVASPAARSAVEADAAVQTLIQRILLAMAAALLVPFALGSLLARRTVKVALTADQG